MMNEEVNVIDHLLDVEKKAAQLVSDAQVEASKRISAARATADADYKKQYGDLAVQLEAEYQKKIDAISAAHAESIDAYKANIQKADKDEKAFNALLDSILFTA